MHGGHFQEAGSICPPERGFSCAILALRTLSRSQRRSTGAQPGKFACPVYRDRMPARMPAVAGLEAGAAVGDSAAVVGVGWIFVVEGALKGSLCPGTLILGRPD